MSRDNIHKTTLNGKPLGSRLDLTMVGDWGTANFHTIWGWVSAHLRWRSAPLSKFTIRTGSAYRDSVDLVGMGEADLAVTTPIRTSMGAVVLKIAAFEKAMDDNDDAIAPSMLYAWACIMEGVPYCNGAPNLAVGQHVAFALEVTGAPAASIGPRKSTSATLHPESGSPTDSVLAPPASV